MKHFGIFLHLPVSNDMILYSLSIPVFQQVLLQHYIHLYYFKLKENNRQSRNIKKKKTFIA